MRKRNAIIGGCGPSNDGCALSLRLVHMMKSDLAFIYSTYTLASAYDEV